jgi:predicted O-methyltransferase YrrM
MTFSSSYTPLQLELITCLVGSVDPKVAVELGTQLGASAVAIARGLSSKGKLFTYDLFEPKYSKPPHAETHANQEKALENIRWAGLEDCVSVLKGDYLKASEVFLQGQVDLLHVDVCNHLGNVRPILSALAPHVRKMIILEGGTCNKWQEAHDFLPFKGMLYSPQFDRWDHVTIPFSEHRAITVMTRRASEPARFDK